MSELSNIRDAFHFTRKLTPRKLWNAVKVYSSYFISKYTKQNIQWGKPLSIAVEPTTSCNLRCPECPSGLRSFTRPTGMIETETFKRIIDETHRELMYLILYFQGEPYLHKKFFEMVEYAAKKKIYVATSTNAHYLNDENAKRTVESGLSRLIISIDGTTQETYEQYRIGGNLEKVIEGAKNIIKWKKILKSKTPHTIFQFLVVKPNQHQIEDIKKLAKEIGVDTVGFKTAQIYDYQNGSELIPTIDYFSRYEKQSDGKYKVKNKMLNHCWKLWNSTVITWDGRVVPCCFDKDAQYQMGQMNGIGFNEIWDSKTYREFRKSVLDSRGNIEMCRNCTEGTKVWG